MKLNGTLLKSTVIAALVAAPMAPVMAQTAGPEAMTEEPAQIVPEAPAAADFSEDQLTSFVDAAMEVQKVQEDYSARIDATPEDADKQALVEEAQTEMVAAVDETEGMDVQTYNEISSAARTNPELNDRLMAMVQTRQGAGNTMTE